PKLSPRSAPPKPRETLGTRTRRARRAAMAKNRNKKNRAKSGGLATMDTSEGGPATSTAADVPQPMDTSEGKQPSSPPRRSVRSTSKLK
ncbi:hypothetical protein ACJX0J_029904, partial [Zea mays]